MTSPTNGDLGHGVRVMPGDGGRIVVQSAEFDLGWRPRVAEQPGSAVVWGGASFEVLEREPWGRGARWTLVPWTGEDVMRVVLPLDGAAVEAAARDARAAAREAALRPWFWLLSPVLGFASASAQRRWRDAWGFPATTANWLSAIFEFVLGGLCIVELMVASQAGVEIFSWIPRWLLFCGLPLCVEGLVRMKMVASDSEPIGSFFGLIGSVFERARKPTPEPTAAPSVETWDDTNGILGLVSTIHRRDWEKPGLLSYKGDLFALDSTERMGESWLYVFGRLEVAENWDGPRLRLIPPRTEIEKRSFADQPGLVKMVLLSIACTLAPRRFQERWAAELGVRAKWFTVMGASAEFIGGLDNLGASEGRSVLTVLLSLFFIGEAMVRLGSVVFRSQTLGSVLGLPLTPILERYLPKNHV